MSEPDAQVLSAIVDCLRACTRENLRPPQALERVESVRGRHRGLALELVWQEEAFDGSFHYDALVRSPAGGTISISVCADKALPWPLRGVQRWRDGELLRVNETVLEVSDAVAQMEVLWESPSLMQRLVDGCLVTEALQNYPVEIDDGEKRDALVAIRRQRGLLSAADTENWMKLAGISRKDLDNMAYAQARTLKLRDRLVGAEVESYFAKHRSDFDRVKLAQFQVRSQQMAHRYAQQARSGAANFLTTAQEAFLADPSYNSNTLFRSTWRLRVPESLRRPLERAAAGDVVGPAADGDGYRIALLLAMEPAQLDAETRPVVAAVLFERWLAERRRTARIEWFWGKAQQTDPLAVDKSRTEA